MDNHRKVFVGGNWKSNNTLAQSHSIVENVLTKLEIDTNRVDVVVAPIFLHLLAVKDALKNTHVQVAAQNNSLYGFGAYTGEVSIQHLKDIGLNWVILGHSQRRTLFGQNDKIVSEKIEQALKHNFNVIACFGETLAERDSNNTISVVQRQLDAIRNKVKIEQWANIVLAYEPVWAIGTGKVATTEQVNEIHTWIRGYLEKHISSVSNNIRIIYGGSVTEKNCAELIKVKDVDGFLVGGASLKAGFIEIVHSYKLKN